jgi:cell division protein FtsB
VTRARWVAVAVLILAAVFAWTGGTFSERNYRDLRRIEIADSQRVRQLAREVDSLRAFRDSLEHDPAVQERVAREQFGMQRPGELTFTIVRDSAPAKRSP